MHRTDEHSSSSASRDWVGKYPMHCHNVVHEDHAMMALWRSENGGDDMLAAMEIGQ